jgi:hypothetical protein
MPLHEHKLIEDTLMPTNTQKQEMDSILANLKKVIKQVNTIQGNVHNVLLESCLYAYKYKDATIVEKIMSNLHSVRGSFRIESVAYWYKQIAGLNVSFKEKTNTWACKFAKKDDYLSEQGISFTFDKAHFNLLKEDKYRFWKIAPVAIKELKIATDLEKITSSAEIQLARSFAAGLIDEAAIEAHVTEMLKRVKSLSGSKKTKEWLEEFYTQHPDQKPVESIDPTEAELEQLEAEIVAEELEAVTI